MSEDQIECPKCHSTQLTADKKGFGLGKAIAGGLLLGPVGLIGGFLGSGNVMITCLRCGNRWSPGEHAAGWIPSAGHKTSGGGSSGTVEGKCPSCKAAYFAAASNKGCTITCMKCKSAFIA